VAKLAKLGIRISLIVLLAAFVFGILWAAVYRAVNYSETKMALSDVSGADIEVVYTNSDALAKQEGISVYISEASKGETGWLRKTFRRKVLLFKYDPGSPYESLPTIISPAVNRLVISVPRVSSISFQRAQWNGISVTYQIGRIDYP
jgi:hypothetical protein